MNIQNQAPVHHLRAQAAEQFRRLQGQAMRGQLWSRMTGKRQHLLNLNEVQKTMHVHSRTHAGLQHVPIAQIRGSEGRCEDFDASFRPLRGHSKDRWVGVAIARTEDVPLPAVQLVQINETYFVRDGHHRISVARLFGQLEIEAEVTVWHGANTNEAM
jgi:hypothetical protein